MSEAKFKFYSDPGHGWLAVKRNLIDELGLKFTVSHYSYQNGKTVYLEEDCDAGIFIQKMREARGIEVKILEKMSNRRSPIRSYEHYRP